MPNLLSLKIEEKESKSRSLLRAFVFLYLPSNSFRCGTLQTNVCNYMISDTLSHGGGGGTPPRRKINACQALLAHQVRRNALPRRRPHRSNALLRPPAANAPQQARRAPAVRLDPLADQQSIQRAINRVFQATLSGSLPPERAAGLLDRIQFAIGKRQATALCAPATPPARAVQLPAFALTTRRPTINQPRREKSNHAAAGQNGQHDHLPDPRSPHLRRRPAGPRLQRGGPHPGQHADPAHAQHHAQHPAHLGRHGHRHRVAPGHRHGPAGRHRRRPSQPHHRAAGRRDRQGQAVRERNDRRSR